MENDDLVKVVFVVDDEQNVLFSNEPKIDGAILEKIETAILFCIETGLIYPEINLKGAITLVDDDGLIAIAGQGTVGNFDSFDFDINYNQLDYNE